MLPEHVNGLDAEGHPEPIHGGSPGYRDCQQLSGVRFGYPTCG
jgi:hypothetical protein